MRTTMRTCLALLCLVSITTLIRAEGKPEPTNTEKPAIGASEPDVWMHDFADAAKVAKKVGRPLLIHFHATWCAPCRQMEKDVLHHSDVRDLLSRNFVAVMIDSDQHPELISQFEIKGLPTDVVIAPDDVVLLKAEGGRDRKTYLAQMRHTLEQLPKLQPSPTPSDRSQDQRIAKESAPGAARVGDPRSTSSRTERGPSERGPRGPQSGLRKRVAG